MKKKHYRSIPHKLALANVDHEEGVLRDVEIIRVGEALGHGHSFDQEAIQSIVELGSKQSKRKDGGVKARFGHPNMSDTTLGTYVGRFRNFREDGKRAIADLHLCDTCKSSPKGDLHQYILEMAETNPDMFGNSVVIRPGRLYKRNKKGKVLRSDFESRSEYEEVKGDEYLEIEELLASDLVDSPAAADNLFSARFNDDKLAVKITQLFDANPGIFEELQKHFGEVEELQPFLNRYNDYSNQRNSDMSLKEKYDALAAKFDAFVQGKDTTETRDPEPQPEGDEDLQSRYDQLVKDNAALQSNFDALKAEGVDQVAKFETLSKRVDELTKAPAYKHSSKTPAGNLETNTDGEEAKDYSSMNAVELQAKALQKAANG